LKYVSENREKLKLLESELDELGKGEDIEEMEEKIGEYKAMVKI
jgi:hypothetical protein